MTGLTAEQTATFFPTVTPRDQTHSWLTFLAHTHIALNKMPWSPAQWVLDNALPVQDWSPLPKRMRRGQPKQCYWNALKLVQRGKGRYVYVEGAATHILTCEHAWCLDRETGLIVDPTWLTELHDGTPLTGTAYYGVPLKAKYVKQCLDQERLAVWDWYGTFPIMTGLVAEEEWKESV